MTETPRVLVEKLPSQIHRWTLNRPEIRNAYDQAMIDQVRAAIADAGETAARAVVLRGSGQHFQAGADLRWMATVRTQSADAVLAASHAAAAMFTELNTLACPLVVAIQGACIGGATGIAAAADIVIATPEAYFSVAEVHWGLTPGFIIPLLCDAIGPRHARRYALTGETFDATEAHRLGLVHEIAARPMTDVVVDRVVGQILLGGPLAVRVTKKHLLDNASTATDPTSLERLTTSHAQTRVTDEAAEGARAFLERRRPTWAPTGTNGLTELA